MNQRELKILEDVMVQFKAVLSIEPTQTVIILSDFDYTLCEEYSFNPDTNDHLAVINTDVIEAAYSHHLIVATSRRANNPTIPTLWESGLIPFRRPIIVENGGVILAKDEDGTIKRINVIQRESLEQLLIARRLIETSLRGIPTGQKLVFKDGLTMMIIRLQDEHGTSLPHHQVWLAEQLRMILPQSSSLQIVNTQTSIVLQDQSINKGTAFTNYLNMINLPRSEAYVIGMGDGENDAAIFNEADISLGFSDAVSSIVDIDIPFGVKAIPYILQTIENATPYSKAEV
jgi:hydroxymethylpyrimidine pyrophosphatase-like HAD family hydrolase